MDIKNNWNTIQNIFKDAYASSLHFSIASVNDEGVPWITPIGSLILNDNMTGFYFEEFPKTLPKNIEKNNKVCVLAVNSDKSFWAKSLLRGKFKDPPAVRLFGKINRKREATTYEIALWYERIKGFEKTKGYEIMWKNMKHIREITFDSFEPVNCGTLTDTLWKD